MRSNSKRKKNRRLRSCERGTMTLTMSQMFMGALTIGIATFHGTQSYESFYYETQLAHATYGASKIAANHARSANVNATNNVISASILGPRFAVEADNMTMIANAIIACPQTHNPEMVKICQEFTTNHPRMLLKLAWVRLEQKLIWGTLGKLTEAIDKVTSMDAVEQITSLVGKVDHDVSLRFEDPSLSMNIWGGDNISVACENAMKDALPSPMPGAAFPVLIHRNLLEGLPKALVQIMPRLLCGGASAAAKAAAAQGQPAKTEKLDMIPNITKKAEEDCTALESEMQAAVASASPFSEDLSKYAVCANGGGFAAAVDTANAASPCTFDRKQCVDDKTEKASADFLDSVGMPSKSSTSSSSLGGGTHMPSVPDWNHSSTMRGCSFATKAIDPTILRINDAARTIMSFGQASSRSSSLRTSHEYHACGRWYFPDAEGMFASAPHEQQPFIAGWKYALVARSTGGGGGGGSAR